MKIFFNPDAHNLPFTPPKHGIEKRDTALISHQTVSRLNFPSNPIDSPFSQNSGKMLRKILTLP